LPSFAVIRRHSPSFAVIRRHSPSNRPDCQDPTFMLRALPLIACLWLAACDQPPVPSAAPAGSASAPATGTAPPPSQAGFDDMINALRAQAGLPAATPDARLRAAAQAHADDMLRNNYVSHTGRNGSDFAQRMRAAGYASCNPAENIAAGQTSEAAVLASWTGSAAHRRNLLLPGSVQYGLGRAGDRWVLLIARVC